MTRRAAALTASIVLAVALTGCGGEAADRGEASAGGETADAAPAAVGTDTPSAEAAAARSRPGAGGPDRTATTPARAPRGAPDAGDSAGERSPARGDGRDPPESPSSGTTPEPDADDAPAAGTAHDPSAADDSAAAARDGRDPRSRAETAPQDAPPSAETIIRRGRQRYDSLRTLVADFRQVIEMQVFDPPRRKEGHGTWYQKKPALFRMDFAEPEDDLIVADGRHLWLYYPSTHPNQVIRASLGETPRGAPMVDMQGRIFREALTRYRPEYAGRDTVSDHATHHLILRPRAEDTDYRRVEVWVDTDSWLVRRLEFLDHSETLRRITLDDLRPDAPVPDSLFRFQPPAGVEVFEG